MARHNCLNFFTIITLLVAGGIAYLGNPLQESGCKSSQQQSTVSIVCDFLRSEGELCADNEIYIGDIHVDLLGASAYDFQNICGANSQILNLGYGLLGCVGLIVLANLFCLNALNVLLSLVGALCSGALSFFILQGDHQAHINDNFCTWKSSKSFAIGTATWDCSNQVQSLAFALAGEALLLFFLIIAIISAIKDEKREREKEKQLLAGVAFMANQAKTNGGAQYIPPQAVGKQL